MGDVTSSSLTLNTGAPQGCVLSPLLYSLYTHDCSARHSSNVIIKFADDTTIVGQRGGLQRGGQLPDTLVPDARESALPPVTINGASLERVSSFKFLGVHISEELTWTEHTTRVAKKAQRCLSA